MDLHRLMTRRLIPLALLCLAGATTPAAMACAIGIADSEAVDRTPDPVDEDRELHLRAAFLLNFAKFTTWPDSAFDGPDAKLVIAIVGDDPFGSVLEQTFRRETIRGRSIEVKRVPVPQRGDAESDEAHGRAIAACAAVVARTHLAYFIEATSASTVAVISTMESRITLTVGDRRAAAERHTALALDRDGERIVIHAHRRRIESLGVQVSSRLLGLAQLVEDGAPSRRGGQS